jgi:hypothetical protein
MLRKANAVLAVSGAFFIVWRLMLRVLPGPLGWLGSLVALAASVYVAPAYSPARHHPDDGGDGPCS